MSKQGYNLEVGNTIPAGTIVLLTSGEYSDYGINGIYRAATDTVVPGTTDNWRRRSGIYKNQQFVPDLPRLSTLLEEINYVEVWSDN